MTFLVDAPCACGRTAPRLGPILAREGQMMKVRGTKVYPSAVSDALNGVAGVAEFVVVAERDEHLSDRLVVMLTSARRGAERASVVARLTDLLRVRPEVRLVDATEVRALSRPPGYRKKRLFVDRRS